MNNEYREFLTLLETFKKRDKLPTLLIHSCCGPCSSYCLLKLCESFDITVYYYNPNIYPSEEFYKRLEVQKELINKLNKNIKIIVEEAPYSVYEEAIKDSGPLGEGSNRCYNCYEFRIKKLAYKACELGFDYYTTVMSVSPYKNSKWINEIGKKYEGKARYLYSDFKKEEGYKKSILLSKQFDLYRQDWCGCAYSIKEHEERINKQNLNNTYK